MRFKSKKTTISDLIGHKNDSIQTPPEIYEALDKIYGFDFDPCPLIKPDWDGLEIEWKSSNFVNPPFSSIKKWLEKGIKESQKGKTSVFLITARTSSKYWFDLVWGMADHIVFLEGATQFPGYKGKLPIPLAVVVYGSKKTKKERPIFPFCPKKRCVMAFDLGRHGRHFLNPSKRVKKVKEGS